MDKDKDEGTTRARRRGAAFDNNTTSKEDNDNDATDSMEDNDKGSEEDPHGHEKEYEEEYYQDLDGQLRRYGDLLVSGSDDELSFEKELSPKKRGNNNEPPAESGETSGSGTPLTERSAKKGLPAEKLTGRKEDGGNTTPSMMSSAPGGGEIGQALEPTQEETEGTPSSWPAQEAGMSSSSSMSG